MLSQPTLVSRTGNSLEIHRPGRPGAFGAGAGVRGPGGSRHLSTDRLLLPPPLPKPESTETNSHLVRGCGRSGRRLLCALSHASTDALLHVLVASFGSPRPASQSASSARWIRAWHRPPRPRLSHRTSDPGHLSTVFHSA